MCVGGGLKTAAKPSRNQPTPATRTPATSTETPPKPTKIRPVALLEEFQKHQKERQKQTRKYQQHQKERQQPQEESKKHQEGQQQRKQYKNEKLKQHQLQHQQQQKQQLQQQQKRDETQNTYEKIMPATPKKKHSKIIPAKHYDHVKCSNTKYVHKFRGKTVVNFIYNSFLIGYFCFVSFIFNSTFFVLESSGKLATMCSAIFLFALSGSKVKLVFKLLILGAFLGPYHRHLLFYRMNQ